MPFERLQEGDDQRCGAKDPHFFLSSHKLARMLILLGKHVRRGVRARLPLLLSVSNRVGARHDPYIPKGTEFLERALIETWIALVLSSAEKRLPSTFFVVDPY
jgi:hypothetical protein